MIKESTPKKPLNIYQRILKIMEDVSYIQKGAKKVNGQYSFVSHDQVSAAIQPLLTKHGVMVLPTVSSHEQVGNRTEVTLEVVFINADDPSDRFGTTSIGYGVDNSDKGPGKGVSYAYKYALLKTFCLNTGDDPEKDTTTNFKADKPEEPALTLNNDQVSTIIDLVEGDHELVDRIFDRYKVKNFNDIKETSFPTILKQLTRIREGK